ncbi:glutamate-5-semialdehyde dehydrogenase [Sulfuriroseicoccus oceanibius]|uniref:Gamma-glutamyl phosphate reductase n=1 Tax=Sulfuriroseicoccus oceanibius TaxID=2707525 RepID=A0A6B3L8S9_9BACT|nr:glutamate-5-semialdehyde dehydrogenase [Sulfuriroseicoccus oceanibius]QQL43876.1 glutamate-5-semialdehyde dehydrogenase [Sulfuriroseicoccus oceanibius]
MSIETQITEMAQAGKRASRRVAALDTAEKNQILEAIADGLERSTAEIIEANAKDLAAAEENGLSSAMIDRLTLDDGRVKAIADAVRQIVKLDDPVGAVIDEFTGAQGIEIRKVRSPIGVIGIIFESRPNVTVDAAVLCLKSGNATILRGGREAIHSNTALAKVINESGCAAGLPENAIQLIPFTDRAAVPALCQADESVDLIIPRGGRGLIEAVISCSRVPVIKHLDGICHVYVAASADPEMAKSIALNAKVQRPGVCNAMETLLVDRGSADQLPGIAAALHAAGVELRVDPEAADAIGDAAPTVAATEDDWHTEYLDLVLSVKVVDGVDAAIDHINHYGSGHSDGIVSGDAGEVKLFLAGVDSSTVYHNASTRFTDGEMFGFGAEIGISTDKLHARGPMALPELTTYKYEVHGTGQVRG